MMTLSASFSEEYRAEFAKRNLKIGAVIKVFTTDTKPPKEKRLILVGASYDKLYFASIFVNSLLNKSIFQTKELQDLCVFLEADTRAYLDHNSFADCSDLKKRPVASLLTLLTEDPSRLLGTLSEEDLRGLREKIKSAPTITNAIKKTFGLFL